MSAKSFLTGGLIAGVVYFLLGSLVFGLILADTMRGYMNESVIRKNEDIILWSLMLGNLCYGFLLSYIFHQTGIHTARRGSAAGATIGLITSLTFDLNFFGTSTMYKDLVIVAFNASAFLVISAITGMALGYWMSKKIVQV